MAKVAGGASKNKKRGAIKRGLDKLREKFIPTFGEQFSKAKKEGKSKFESTRDDTTKGKLEYHTRSKAEEDKAKKKYTARERARAGDKSQQLTDRGAKFKVYRKLGKKEFTHEGKKYTTLKKGEKPDKWLPELSGKTSKKIKRVLKQHGGSAAQQHYTQHGYGPHKTKLIKGQPKLAVKGWN